VIRMSPTLATGGHSSNPRAANRGTLDCRYAHLGALGTRRRTSAIGTRIPGARHGPPGVPRLLMGSGQPAAVAGEPGGARNAATGMRPPVSMCARAVPGGKSTPTRRP